MNDVAQPIRKLESGRDLLPRDLNILRELFDARLLTNRDLARIFFESKHSAYKRLAALKEERLIAERPRMPNQEAVLFLAKRGFELLREEGALDGYPAITWSQFEKRAQVSPNTLRHELDVARCRAALIDGIKGAAHLTLRTFTTWPMLCRFDTVRPSPLGGEQSYSLFPDGYLSVDEKVDEGAPYAHYFFMEVDRSSEIHDTFADKAYGYQAHYRRGGFAQGLGFTQAEFQDFPFIVLMVLRNVERRNNIAARLVQNKPATLTQGWLTTLEELDRDPLGQIWIRPVDYRNLTRDTPFDAMKQVFKGYRSNPQREQFIAERIAKHRLFDAL